MFIKINFWIQIETLSSIFLKRKKFWIVHIGASVRALWLEFNLQLLMKWQRTEYFI